MKVGRDSVPLIRMSKDKDKSHNWVLVKLGPPVCAYGLIKTSSFGPIRTTSP